MQNPGWQAGASRDLLGGWSRPLDTHSDWRAQLLASRYSLSPSMAQLVSSQAFGEARHD
jgi:hypothetical protein